jgi:chromosome segregation ATPase
MTLDQQFNLLNEKLLLLLKQHGRLKKENEHLREQLNKVSEERASAQSRIDELSQQVAILKLSLGEMTEKDKKAFELKINRYVKEIDKCIAFLGQ